MNILYINTFDHAGGAELICWELFTHQKEASMLVKNKLSQHPNVSTFPVYNTDKIFFKLDQFLFKFGLKSRLKSKLSVADQGNQTYEKLRTMEAYQKADIIHLHNIHGGYFDLKALEDIAKEKKIVWTLHDMWPVTGGESYTLENENYTIGIGKTPYLNMAPLNDPWLDRRQHHIELKKKIYEKINASITFVPVSAWMESVLRKSYVFQQEMRVNRIDNGYDELIYFNKRQRKQDTPKVLFFNSNNIYKGCSVFTDIIEECATKMEITNIGIPINHQNVRNLPYIKNRAELAEIYNQHDILVLPSLAESFSLVALEAMACGVCVIASNAGALPERIHPEWGYLFDVNNSDSLKEKLFTAISDLNNTRLKGEMAAEEAKKFTFTAMFKKYEDLYHKIAG